MGKLNNILQLIKAAKFQAVIKKRPGRDGVFKTVIIGKVVKEEILVHSKFASSSYFCVLYLIKHLHITYNGKT